MWQSPSPAEQRGGPRRQLAERHHLDLAVTAQLPLELAVGQTALADGDPGRDADQVRVLELHTGRSSRSRASIALLADCDASLSSGISPGAPLCWELRAVMARWPRRMRNRFDHLAKQIGQKALGPSGTTVTQDAINPETQYADLRYEPDPARQGERDRLGLLGRLAACACILEVYSEAPQAEDFRACLTRHLAAWQHRVRDARSESKKRNEPPPREDSVASFLWIIAAGAPASLVTKLKLERSPYWPTGIYLFGDPGLRGVVQRLRQHREDVVDALVALPYSRRFFPSGVLTDTRKNQAPVLGSRRTGIVTALPSRPAMTMGPTIA